MNIFESDLRPMEYWYTQAMKKLDRWATGIPEGYSTGFERIDDYCRLVAPELMVVAARPSQGKTSLGMQMMESVAHQLQKSGEPGCVAVFSAEMAGWSLYLRMASALCGVNTHKLRSGHGTPDEIQRLEETMRSIRRKPIWIDDNTSPTTAQMLEQLSKLNETMPVKAMLFDFMELGGDKATSEEQRISTIAKTLKGINKTLQIPIVALSQLNRDVENRANKMPTLADLRYSGMIEQLADVVMFIMRPEYYAERGMAIADVPTEDLTGKAYIQIAKNRNGPVGLVRLGFEKDRSRFTNLERVEWNQE